MDQWLREHPMDQGLLPSGDTVSHGHQRPDFEWFMCPCVHVSMCPCVHVSMVTHNSIGRMVRCVGVVHGSVRRWGAWFGASVEGGALGNLQTTRIKGTQPPHPFFLFSLCYWLQCPIFPVFSAFGSDHAFSGHFGNSAIL